jgi:hypothetical protein
MNSKAIPLEAVVLAAGTARADLATIAGMRKRLPAWSPPDVAGHFLKHADEQTVVAVAAVDRAIADYGLGLDEQRRWAIIAAPRYIGRLAGVNVLDRFARGGGPAVSPHAIPQHSLHSVSGALSVLLASHAPNFGVGGSRESLAEGLLAAVTLECLYESTAAWVVCTAWDPEPTAGADGRCTNEPVCHAFALAVQNRAARDRRDWGGTDAAPGGLAQMRVVFDVGSAAWGLPSERPAGVPQIAAALDAAGVGNGAFGFFWSLPGRVTVALEIRAAVKQRSAA